MIITQDVLSQINEVQAGILSDVVAVCDTLGLRYFMVHGSLLGTVLRGDFMPLDDDIDIAMPRHDYNIFLQEAQAHLKDFYFVQSDLSEAMYPLPFAKVRDSRTTYVVEKMRHLPVNHGIYIDVFPIDFYKTGGSKNKLRRIQEKMLDIRVGCAFSGNHLTVMQKIRQILSRVLYPSWKCAVKKRNRLVQGEEPSAEIILTGGKPAERGIPAEWFSGYQIKKFRSLEVRVPLEYEKYLSAIYGDYLHHDVTQGNKVSEDEVEVNACLIDLSKPYIPEKKQ